MVPGPRIKVLFSYEKRSTIYAFIHFNYDKDRATQMILRRKTRQKNDRNDIAERVPKDFDMSGVLGRL